MTKVFSWFRRVFASFGEEPTYNECMQLVERSRQGDQVATATISMVRKNAEAGSEKARQSLEEIKRYARSSAPMAVNVGADAMALRSACFGEDIDNVGMQLSKVSLSDPNTAVVTLANSCNVRELAGKINECIKSDAFQHTFKRPGLFLELIKQADNETQHALLLGYVMGMANRLQAVRHPKCPVAVFSCEAAWELGQ